MGPGVGATMKVEALEVEAAVGGVEDVALGALIALELEGTA